MDKDEIDKIIQNIKGHDVWKKDFENLYDVLKNGLMEIEFIPKSHLAITNLILTSDFILSKTNDYLKKFDLSIAQKNVLEALFYSNCNLTQDKLSKFVLSSKSNISSLLDRMERKKLIERFEDSNNKRVKLVKITDEGKDKLVKLFYDNVHLEYEKILTHKEAEQLNNLLFKLKKGFEDLQ